MEMVLFVGLQGSGKSTFYHERISPTHLRINLDMLKTRYREQRLLEVCFETGMRFVVDNTNPTRSDRQRYIAPARLAGFRVIGYYFESKVEDCKRRNEERPTEQRIPLPGLLGTYSRLEIPSRDEGFDELYYVKISAERQFMVQDWIDEV